MGKKCLKCGYERQPGDMAPDYECPRCGAIYAKVEAYQKTRESLPEQADRAEPVRAVPTNRFGRWVGKHPVLCGCFVLLCVLVGAGVLLESFMTASLETQSKAFRKNLSMADKASFERSLHDLTDLAETVHKRLRRYSLSSDVTADHALCVMDRTMEFVDRMKLAADGKALLYDYSVGRTERILYGNLKLIFDQVEDKKAKAILSQRLTLLRLRGGDMPRKMASGGQRKIVRPATESEQRRIRDEKEFAQYKLAMGALRMQCSRGNSHACEALEDMEQRHNPAEVSYANNYRMWQGWARRARQRAKNINDKFETDVEMQTWNGKWVAFNRDNVEEIIERERPVKP